MEFEKADTIPDILYHGTKGSIAEILNNEGLKKGAREYVHLTENVNIATQNAERWKEKNIYMIKIDAKKMKADGIEILKSKNNVFLVESVSPQYFISTQLLENKRKNRITKKI